MLDIPVAIICAASDRLVPFVIVKKCVIPSVCPVVIYVVLSFFFGVVGHRFLPKFSSVAAVGHFSHFFSRFLYVMILLPKFLINQPKGTTNTSTPNSSSLVQRRKKNASLLLALGLWINVGGTSFVCKSSPPAMINICRF
jgi:hypothetical protein